jgi:hyperosmotically inducible protein
MSAIIDRANGRTSRDAELEQAAQEALLRYGTLRIWGHALQITASSGVVTCEGHVRTTPSKETAERLIREVPGVREVVNHLFVDTDLEIAAAQALANDSRTVNSFPGILVGCAFGEVLLKGSVSSQEAKKAAGDIAAKVPGVRTVTNELVAPEPPKPATPAKPTGASQSASAGKPASKPAPNPAVEEGESSEE